MSQLVDVMLQPLNLFSRCSSNNLWANRSIEVHGILHMLNCLHFYMTSSLLQAVEIVLLLKIQLWFLLILNSKWHYDHSEKTKRNPLVTLNLLYWQHHWKLRVSMYSLFHARFICCERKPWWLVSELGQ